MKKILQSATLSLCISMPYAHATPMPPMSVVITTAAPSITTSIDLKNTFNTEAVLRLYQNAYLITGGVFVGLMGLDMVRQSIQRMVDKALDNALKIEKNDNNAVKIEKNDNNAVKIGKNDNVSYGKLLAKGFIGAGLIVAAGFGIQTILK